MARVAGLIFYAISGLWALIFIWGTRFLPMQDYPDWLFQGFAFSRIIQGQPLGNYQVTGWMVPNVISTLLIGGTSLLVNPEISGKVFLTLYVLVFLLGSAYLLRSLGASWSNPLVYLPLVFVLNDPFFHGYLNYCLSLGLLFLGIGYLSRRSKANRPPSLWIMVLLSTGIYASHGASYVSWLVVVVVFGLFHRSRRRLSPALLGLLPSLALSAVYLRECLRAGLQTQVQAGADSGLRSHVMLKATSAISYLSPFHRFYPFFDRHQHLVDALAVVALVFSLVVFALIVWWLTEIRKSGPTARMLSLASGILILIFAVSPCYFAGIHDPGQRFIYPALWIVAAVMAPKLGRGVRRRASLSICVLLVAIFGLQIVFVHLHGGFVARTMEDLYQRLEEARPIGGFTTIYESDFDYEGQFNKTMSSLSLLRLPSNSPLGRLHYYLNIETETPAPVFGTGLLSERSPSRRWHSAGAIANAEEYPETVLILGETSGNRFIAGLLEGQYSTDLVRPFLTVMSRQR